MSSSGPSWEGAQGQEPGDQCTHKESRSPPTADLLWCESGRPFFAGLRHPGSESWYSRLGIHAGKRVGVLTACAHLLFCLCAPDQEGRHGAWPPSTALHLECPGSPMTPLPSALRDQLEPEAKRHCKASLGPNAAAGDTRLPARPCSRRRACSPQGPGKGRRPSKGLSLPWGHRSHPCWPLEPGSSSGEGLVEWPPAGVLVARGLMGSAHRQEVQSSCRLYPGPGCIPLLPACQSKPRH